MANLITYGRRSDLPPIKVGNGRMSLLMAALAVAASDLAVDEGQRAFAAWFASHDQSVFGNGTVGFDVGEMPWNAGRFDADRDFVLAAVRAAQRKSGWDRLGPSPAPEAVAEPLAQFESMIRAFDAADASRDAETVWEFGGRPDGFDLCPRHAVYRHAMGCLLCNEWSEAP